MQGEVIERRRARVRALRDSGLSIREVARELGVGPTTVTRDLEAVVPESRPAPVAAAGPGNRRAVSHGGHSSRLVEPRAHELAPSILEANPHLDPARDGVAVFRYAVALARVERAYAWLFEQHADAVFADVDAGRVHAVYSSLERWERQCDSAEERLAIAPLTRARLGLDKLRAAQISDAALEADIAAGREIWARVAQNDNREVS